MALINCDECGFELSDKASACPKCGNPISSNENNRQTLLVEQTSKDLKLKLIIGMVVVVLGMILSSSVNETFGFIIGICGLIYMIVVKVSIWWNHK